MKKTLLTLLIAASVQIITAQNVLDKSVYLNLEQATVYDVLSALERQCGIRFCYDTAVLPWYQIKVVSDGKNLFKVLNKLLPPNGLAYAALGDNLFAVCQPQDRNSTYLKDLKQRWEAGAIEMPAFIKPLEQAAVLGMAHSSTDMYEVTGLLRDEESKEALAGVAISVGGENHKTLVTNTLGQFTVKLVAGEHLLTTYMPGYRESKMKLSLYDNGNIEILMAVKPEALQEVLIEGNRASNRFQNSLTGVEAIPMRTIKELPALLGEADVIKSLSTLAGVTSAGEGASGFNVRGGNIDQNLTLQDDAPLFNTSHVLGFFSVYNPDLIRSVTLYKGHVPAQYGGRTASVLDVKLRDGNLTKHHGQIGFGIAAGKLIMEGPLWKNKVSYMLGLRRSYSDWMLKLVPLAEGKTSSAWFFDGLSKISIRLGQNSTIAATAYGTKDYFRYGQAFGYEWNNRLVNVVAKHPIGAKIVSSWQGNYGTYKASYSVPVGINAFGLNNGLEYYNLGWRAIWVANTAHEVTGGIQWNTIKGLPEVLNPVGASSVILPANVRKDRGEDWVLFLQDEWKWSEKWRFSMGMRGVYYRNIGEKTVYTYGADQPQTVENIIDSVFYEKGNTVKTYAGLEPRLSASWRWRDQKIFKFSYNRMRQYAHLISNLVSPTPVDIWQVSNPYIAPQTADNFDIGYSTAWNDRRYELDADVFYRKTRSVPVFRNFANLLVNDHLETELLSGSMESYGAECSVKKKQGYWTGWLTYTYTRSLIRAKSPFADLTINEGNRYPSDYDQPHQVNVYAKYAWNPASSLSFNFIYRSGRPVSGPPRVYQVGGIVVPDYVARNNFRIQDYIRLDVSMNIDQNKSKISGVKRSVSIGFYNLLGRKNPYSVFFRRDANTYPKAYKLSIIGSVIPSLNITYAY